MRGTTNESIAGTALEAKDCVSIVYDVGLLMKKDVHYYAASPDGIEPIDWMSVDSGTDWTPAHVVHSSSEPFSIVLVEVKVLISEESLRSILHAHLVGIQSCTASSAIVRIRLPEKTSCKWNTSATLSVRTCAFMCATCTSVQLHAVHLLDKYSEGSCRVVNYALK